MKIGVVVGRFPVVSEQFIINQIAGLIDAGHDVHILSVSSGDLNRIQPMVHQYSMLERTTFAGVPRSLTSRVFLLPLVFFWNFLRRPIQTVTALRYDRYRTGVTSGKTLFFLNTFGSRSFDLLHVHFGPNGLTGAFLKDIGVAKRLAVAFHGSDINTYPRRYGKNIYQYMYSRCDLVTVNTSFTGGKVVSNGASEQIVRIVPESLKIEEYPYVERNPEEACFRILTVGRLVDKKGHRYVLPAIAAVRGSIHGLRYRMVGDGPNRHSLESQATDLGIDDICDFVGLKTSDEIREEYSACDLFVLASVTAPSGDMEGQGLVLQEAQASGCPVLTTRHNGIPDGLIDGETGVLVPEGDSDGLATAILELAGDRDRLVEMGRRGSEFVRSRYDIRIVTETLERWYRELLPR